MADNSDSVKLTECVPGSRDKAEHTNVYVTTGGHYDLCGDCGTTWENGEAESHEPLCFAEFTTYLGDGVDRLAATLMLRCSRAFGHDEGDEPTPHGTVLRGHVDEGTSPAKANVVWA